MKKLIIIVLLLSATTLLYSQAKSRLYGGMGGGLYLNSSLKALLGSDGGGTGVASFAYFIGHNHTAFSVGAKSGLNISYNRILHRVSPYTDSYTVADHAGATWNYSTTANDVRYLANSLTFDIPVMFAMQYDHIYFDFGAKFLFPIWNDYSQSFASTEIKAESPDKQIYINDPKTGIVPADQYSLSGNESLCPMYIGFTFDFGSVFRVTDNHRLGFELFLDIITFGIGGNSDPMNRKLIDVGQIPASGESPVVTVNPLCTCTNFHNVDFKTGIKLVYCFDIDHEKREAVKEEPVILLTPKDK